MPVDKHMLQQWVAGAEIRFEKTHQPLADIPLVKRIKKLAARTQSYVHKEKIDLTRARDFVAQQTSEDLLYASIDLPILGKRGVGNDIGMAVASFRYTDEEGDEHSVVAICSYSVSGLVAKQRALKQIVTIPMA